MPTIIVNRDALFKAIGQSFTDEEFENLCFEFGIELDDVTSEQEIMKNEQKKEDKNLSTETLYKIEVAANRYDLLCLEGLALALRIFLSKQKMPEIKPLNILPEEERQLIVYDSVNDVRPIGLCAILRDINFTDEMLKSFMDLQDKLHNNICRGRKLVSMGTHDLDKVKGPFSYRALSPEKIHFVPLNREEEVNGDGLMSLLKDVIMSLPPIINSQHTKMTLNTHNVLLDITGIDLTKCEIVLNTLIAMFSVYCKNPFTVEEIKVINQKTGEGKIYPDLTPRKFQVDINYLKTITGIYDILPEKITKLLEKMELSAKILNPNEIEVLAPITRSDILHPCDIAEDLAISYGYNNIKKELTTTKTHGVQQPYNKLADFFRDEMAMGGYVEFLTMALLSHKDMFTNLLSEKRDDKTVQILYSKSKEFEYIRSSLIPGILKSIEGNKANQLPFKIFEISDVVEINQETEVGAVNRRKLCFAYTNTVSAMEIVQGMVDLLMKKIGLGFNSKNVEKKYYIKKSENKIFFEDRQAEIYILNDIKVGIYGIVHPKVIKNFGIKNPVTLCEIDLQLIMDLIIEGKLLEGFV